MSPEYSLIVAADSTRFLVSSFRVVPAPVVSIVVFPVELISVVPAEVRLMLAVLIVAEVPPTLAAILRLTSAVSVSELLVIDTIGAVRDAVALLSVRVVSFSLSLFPVLLLLIVTAPLDAEVILVLSLTLIAPACRLRFLLVR